MEPRFEHTESSVGALLETQALNRTCFFLQKAKLQLYSHPSAQHVRIKYNYIRTKNGEVFPDPNLARPLNLAAMSDLRSDVSSQTQEVLYLPGVFLNCFLKETSRQDERNKNCTMQRLLHGTLRLRYSPTVEQIQNGRTVDEIHRDPITLFCPCFFLAETSVLKIS